jgi:hypothetical protein
MAGPCNRRDGRGQASVVQGIASATPLAHVPGCYGWCLGCLGTQLMPLGRLFRSRRMGVGVNIHTF